MSTRRQTTRAMTKAIAYLAMRAHWLTEDELREVTAAVQPYLDVAFDREIAAAPGIGPKVVDA